MVVRHVALCVLLAGCSGDKLGATGQALAELDASVDMLDAQDGDVDCVGKYNNVPCTKNGEAGHCLDGNCIVDPPRRCPIGTALVVSSTNCIYKEGSQPVNNWYECLGVLQLTKGKNPNEWSVFVGNTLCEWTLDKYQDPNYASCSITPDDQFVSECTATVDHSYPFDPKFGTKIAFTSTGDQTTAEGIDKLKNDCIAAVKAADLGTRGKDVCDKHKTIDFTYTASAECCYLVAE